MIRVAVVAESAVVRAGIETLLRAHGNFELVESHPDVVVHAGDEPVLETSAPTVILTETRDPEWTRDALRLGARAVLPRDASQEEIVAAVEAAAAGLVALDPASLDALAGAAPRAALAADPVEPLTPREIEVLRMLAEGEGNKTIAWKLGISDHTVKFHVASIMAKLRASSRTEAVTIGIRRGLILL
ncbi:MAG: response regulator transcription factor [Acidobacteriota bacterium]